MTFLLRQVFILNIPNSPSWLHKPSFQVVVLSLGCMTLYCSSRAFNVSTIVSHRCIQIGCVWIEQDFTFTICLGSLKNLFVSTCTCVELSFSPNCVSLLSARDPVRWSYHVTSSTHCQVKRWVWLTCMLLVHSNGRWAGGCGSCVCVCVCVCVIAILTMLSQNQTRFVWHGLLNQPTNQPCAQPTVVLFFLCLSRIIHLSVLVQRIAKAKVVVLYPYL